MVDINDSVEAPIKNFVYNSLNSVQHVLSMVHGEESTGMCPNQVTGIRTLLNPLARTSSKVSDVTGELFHESSLGKDSRLFPRFHPGVKAANAADAVIGVNSVVHAGMSAVWHWYQSKYISQSLSEG